MCSSTNFLLAFFEKCKEHGIRVCVLRNFEKLPEEIPGSDVDISINKEDLKVVQKFIPNLARITGYAVHSRYKKSYRIEHWRLVSIADQDPDHIRLDIMSDVGIGNQIIWSRAYITSHCEPKLNGLFWGPSLSLQIAIVVSYSAFRSIRIKKKYLDHLYEPRMLESVKTHLKDIGLELKSVDLSSGLTVFNHVEYNACSITKIIDTIHLWISKVNRVKKPSGIMVSFTGPDGSGKTSVIKALIDRDDNIYSDYKVFHLRPHLFRALSELKLQRKIRRTRHRGSTYNHPKISRQAINKLFEIVRLLYYWLDYIIGYWFIIRPLLARDFLVIFDRYYYDYYFDFDQKAVKDMNPLIRFLEYFVPSPDYNFILKADAHTINKRKPELDPAQIQNQYQFLEENVSNKKNSIIVRTDLCLPKAVKLVQNVIYIKNGELQQDE